MKDTITAREKSEELFCWLYERFSKKAFGQALSYCRSEQDAEDCVQDVFLKVWEHLQQLQAKIKDWHEWHSFLFVMTRNRASNLIRRSRNKEALIESYAEKVNPVIFHDDVLEKEHTRIFTEAIEELSYQQREKFILKYYRFKPRIIAKELMLSPITVRNTLVSARKILVERVSKEFEINESLIKLANENAR